MWRSSSLPSPQSTLYVNNTLHKDHQILGCSIWLHLDHWLKGDSLSQPHTSSLLKVTAGPNWDLEGTCHLVSCSTPFILQHESIFIVKAQKSSQCLYSSNQFPKGRLAHQIMRTAASLPSGNVALSRVPSRKTSVLRITAIREFLMLWLKPSVRCQPELSLGQCFGTDKRLDRNFLFPGCGIPHPPLSKHFKNSRWIRFSKCDSILAGRSNACWQSKCSLGLSASEHQWKRVWGRKMWTLRF